ncbi:MAG: transglycosylase SLT domain-containing protein [Bacteroidales bacterium]|jgi:membrane-bound lytic murein transglycosylase F|nr:transglycosylase SLT domain-containing protein [Bacteroidales bacterium]
MSIRKEPHSIAIIIFVLVLIAGSVFADGYAGKLARLRAGSEVVDTLPRGMCANYIISPYDSLIKHYSDSVGLDWRLVSAVIYHESRFDNDVRSHRGAAGLMQMMPSTAEWLGADDITDPIEGVRVGTLYLKRLHNAYRNHTDDPQERLKFALAAYNAGIGRIQDCIHFARLRGVDSSYWANIVSIIPEMRDDSILEIDTIKFGKFRGDETIAYVDNVLEKYEQYKRKAAR